MNLQASGPSDLRLILVQQRFAVDGRPVANPPDAGPLGFVMMPGQEINVNFEVSFPDREFREGDLMYGLHVGYEDEGKTRRELEVFWWYDFAEDKFWNNLNKVTYFDPKSFLVANPELTRAPANKSLHRTLHMRSHGWCQ